MRATHRTTAGLVRGRPPLLATVFALAGSLTLAATAGSAELPGSFKGRAYGAAARATTGPIANDLGRLAILVMPCEGTHGVVRVENVDSPSFGIGGSFFRANNVRSTIFSNKSARRATVRNSSEITELNMLAGLITADEINAFAHVVATARDINVSPKGSGFTNLRIAGIPVDDPRPNTEMAIPGVGRVILKRIDRGNRTISVEMIRLTITEPNNLGLQVGGVIIVGHARAAFTRAELERLVDGVADIATSGVGTVSHQTKEAHLGVPCEGTGGETLSKTVVNPSIGNVFSAHSGQTTAFGGHTDVGLVVRTTSRIERANLLDGLIKARVIQAVAEDKFRAGTRKSSTKGTKVAGLQIGGLSHGTITARNTQINVPGVGHVIINEAVTPDATSRERTKASALRLVVTENNSFGLPIGARIAIGAASSFIKTRTPGADGQTSGHQPADDDDDDIEDNFGS